MWSHGIFLHVAEVMGAAAGRNERIFVAGHSAGGQVAEDYALKKTGGLILLVS